MAFETILRRLRGAVGNALVWGVGWFTAGLAIFGTAVATGIVSGPSWTDVLTLAGQAGILGGVAGGAFSVFIGVVYRGRRLSEINWIRFGLGAGVLAAVFLPLFMQTMNLLSGQGLVPWGLVLDDIPLVALLGAGVGGGSMKLAQISERALSDGSKDRLEDGEVEMLEGE